MNLQEEQIPRQWYCPITQQIMKDPVIAADGFTYEKKSIQQWFTRSDHSPLTGLKLVNINLIPNHALRQTISKFVQKSQNIPKLKIKAEPPCKPLELPALPLSLASTCDNSNIYIKCAIQSPEYPNLTQNEGSEEKLPQNQSQSHLRNNCSIICILDISESMDTDSLIQESGKSVESHGFSRLDLVKHSINTLVEFMGDHDQIALVVFSTSANIALPMTRTTKAGKNIIRQILKNLQTIGTTNIWDGLRISIQLLKQLHSQQRSKTHNISLLLLTDGQPNLNPPRGIVPTLTKYLQLQKIEVPNINVFGYGYELDTFLLMEIAEIGHGSYMYIPDCSMVGTAFVNFMANLLTMVTNQAVLKVDIGGSYKKGVQILGLKTGSKEFHVGAIVFGQNRQFLIKIPISVYQSLYQQERNIKVTLTYGNKKLTSCQSLNLQKTQNPNLELFLLKQRYLSLLQRLSKSKKSQMDQFYKQICQFNQQVVKLSQCPQFAQKDDQFIQNILLQLKNENENYGQVSKSFQKQQWYQKWGKHYISSLYRSHMLQICTNFKDPTLQLYGGSMFKQQQNVMDTIFIKMPPPQPTAKKEKNVVYKQVPVDMSQYYNQQGGCIHEDCQVQLKNGKLVEIKNLKKGDLVANGGKVLCIVRTPVYKWVEMIQIGNLIITPYHPIMYNNQWIFPCNHPQSQKNKIFIETYYNYILEPSDPTAADTESHLTIQGIKCISLGHNMNHNLVVSHEYFGKRIVSDLKKLSGWPNGDVIIREFIRNQQTKRVEAIVGFQN